MPIALPRKGRFPPGNRGRKDKQKLFRKQPAGSHCDQREDAIAISPRLLPDLAKPDKAPPPAAHAGGEPGAGASVQPLILFLSIPRELP